MFAGIILVNDDLSPNVQAALVSQLFISEVVDGYEFDQRVIGNPEYPLVIKQNNIRLLVVRSFYDLTNRELADFAIFCKAGQAAIEDCRVGPPGYSLAIYKLSYKEIFHHFPRHDFDDCGCDGYSPIQDNILFPLTCRGCGRPAFPFGEECYRWQREKNPYNLPIYCECPGGPWQWLG